MSLRELAKRRLPYPAKQGLKYIYSAIPARFRYGKVFWDTYNFLQESQWWSRKKLEEYQMQQLSRLLRHAYENVPYYRRVFDERGLKPNVIQDFNDLRKLPYLTKGIIRENLRDLVARNYPRSKLEYVTTGGSTGIPLGFYWKRDVTDLKEWAFVITLWSRVGFELGNRCVVLRGNVVRSVNKGKFWEYDPLKKDLIISSYHMTDELLPNYIVKIREFRPDFIQAYPSAITILARFMKDNDIKPFPTVKAVLCTSENLYSWQRELLEEVMKCRVWSFYGHAERAALAGECEVSTYYHIQPEYGIVELINKDGNPLTNEDELGEIVATGFNNSAMPFIRYRTMDLAVPANSRCSCGRNYSLMKRIEGRVQELIMSKDGRLIPHVSWIHEAAWKGIKQIQFVQQKQGEIIFQVVKNTSKSERQIERHILRLYGPKFEGLCEVSLRFVDYIPCTKSGKFRFLVQKLPIDWGGCQK